MIANHPVIALLVAVAAMVGAWKLRGPARVVLAVAAILLVGGWVPLLVAAALDPGGNPVGLGLLAWFASDLGLLLTLATLAVLAVKRLRRPG